MFLSQPPIFKILIQKQELSYIGSWTNWDIYSMKTLKSRKTCKIKLLSQISKWLMSNLYFQENIEHLIV